MSNLTNKVVLFGRLGRDPETNVFQNGGSATNFSIATDESYKDRDGNKVERTEWHNIVFNGKAGEVIAKYFRKGSRIYLEGKLRTRTYEVNGENRYITEIIGHSFEFVDPASTQQQSEPAPMDPSGGNGDEDDLPF